jgi:hypothetical protein
MKKDGRDSNESESLFQALAILRAARQARKDRLTLLETCARVLDEAASFEEWSKQSTSLQSVQLDVEGKSVMMVTDVRSVTFNSVISNLSSNQNAVMQILTADHDGKPIVLSTVILSLVPDTGLKVPVPLPNGQRLELDVHIKESGQVHTKLTLINETENATSENALEPYDKQAIRQKGLWLNFFQFRQSMMARPAFAFALILVITAAGAVWKIQPERTESLELARLNYTQPDIPTMPSPTRDASQPIPSPEETTPVKSRRPSVVSIALTPLADEVRSTSSTLRAPRVQTVSLDRRSPLHLTFKLPEYSEAGLYTIRHVTPQNKTLFTTRTVSSRGKTVRLIVKPGTLSPGSHTFELSLGESAVYYYLRVNKK